MLLHNTLEIRATAAPALLLETPMTAVGMPAAMLTKPL
jgi:hypothetical protein